MGSFKIALHWQILAAIIFAVIFGVSFPTQYKFTAESFENFRIKTDEFNSFELKNLERLASDEAMSRSEFLAKAEEYADKKFEPAQVNEILKEAKYNPQLSWVSWMGVLFLKALKMIIIPLILSSIISGIANIGSANNLGRLSIKTIIYYLTTSSLAIFTGLLFVNLINPGKGVDIGFTESPEQFQTTSNSLTDTLLNIVPENIFNAFAQQDMLAIIFFSIMFGFFISKTEYKQKQLLTDFFNAIFELMMKMTMFIIRFTPFGVFGIVAKTVASYAGDSDKLSGLAESLGLYSLTVILALAFHALLVLPFIVRFIGNANPYKHFKAMRTALLTAFSTSSSGATLSVTMKSVTEGSGVSNKVAGFTLPLGATVNMDGTALYEGIVALFIAQAYGIELGLSDQIIILITALLASIGAAGIPMAGLVMTSVVLSAVGLPLEGVGLILAVDKILDMFRTSVNVWSDSCGAVIVAKSEGEKLNV